MESNIKQCAARLVHGRFDSASVVCVDSVLTASIFGRNRTSGRRRLHRIQALAQDFTLDDTERHELHRLYETKVKDKIIAWYTDEDKEAMMTSLSNILYRASDTIKRCGLPSARSVISWWLAAYTMVIAPKSHVKLTVTDLGPDQVKGFAIYAKTHIPKNSTIHELIGLMPYDNKTPHTRLSEITPSDDQNQLSDEVRILFGPIRFVNHLCKEFNAAFMSVQKTSAFYVYALRDIEPNEEITVDYGSEYFADSEGGCPCKTCKPATLAAQQLPKGNNLKRKRTGSDVDGYVQKEAVLVANKSEKNKEKNKARNKVRHDRRKLQKAESQYTAVDPFDTGSQYSLESRCQLTF